jgi:hypothetical protein
MHLHKVEDNCSCLLAQAESASRDIMYSRNEQKSPYLGEMIVCQRDNDKRCGS